MNSILQAGLSITLFCIVGFLAYMYYPGNYFAVTYQNSLDCKRVQDINFIASLMEDYFRAKGHYPLATPDAPVAISVIISNEPLPKKFEHTPSEDIVGKLIPASSLQQALNAVLDAPVTLPADPQTGFFWSSRYYLYKLDTNGDYTLSASMYSAMPYTLKAARYHHRYQLGSAPSATIKTWQYKERDTAHQICEAS